MVRRRRRQNGVAVELQRLELPLELNQVCSKDFVSDALSNARRIKVPTIVDAFSKEAVNLFADFGIPGMYVTQVLDQGPEFTGKALDQWAYNSIPLNKNHCSHVVIRRFGPRLNKCVLDIIVRMSDEFAT